MIEVNKIILCVFFFIVFVTAIIVETLQLKNGDIIFLLVCACAILLSIIGMTLNYYCKMVRCNPYAKIDQNDGGSGYYENV